MSDENNFEDEFDDLDMDLDEDLMDDLDSDAGDDWDEDFEDWDENADSLETTGQSKPEKAKKKGGLGKLLFILILLGGAGGALYFTVLGGKTPGSNGQGQQNMAANQAGNGQMNNQPSDMAALSTSAMPDVNSTSMDMGAMPPMPTAMVMDDDAVPANDGDVDSIEFPKMDMGGTSTGGLTPMPDFSAPEPSVIAAPAMPAIMAPTPSIAMPTRSAPKMPAIEAPEPVMAMPDFDGAAPISAPEMPVKSVKAPVAAAIAPVVETPVTTSGVSSQRVLRKLDNVTNQMDDIVARIDRLERELSKVRASGSDVSQLSSELRSIKKELKISANDTARRPSRVTPVKPAYKAPKRAAIWVLKGIAQNEAWIAQEGSTDIKKVSVGDTVKGLGRISSIGLENGVWMVRGTQGSVKQ